MPVMDELRVLVVDDNDVNRLLAVHVLRERGWTVAEAAGGLEAMMHLETADFDAVLLDVAMPYLGGDQLCGWIRADDRLRDMAVIGFTAHVMPDDVRRLESMGFDHVIRKPASNDEIVRGIAEHVRRP